jgi:hypothetical protein
MKGDGMFEGFMLAKYTINDFEIDFQDDKVSFHRIRPSDDAHL